MKPNGNLLNIKHNACVDAREISDKACQHLIEKRQLYNAIMTPGIAFQK